MYFIYYCDLNSSWTVDAIKGDPEPSPWSLLLASFSCHFKVIWLLIILVQSFKTKPCVHSSAHNPNTGNDQLYTVMKYFKKTSKTTTW